MRFRPILSGIALTLAVPAPVAACSRVPDPLPPQPGSVHFLGRALADTVLAGPGAVQHRTTGGGHFGPGTSRAIYGQRIRVVRLGEGAPDPVRRAIDEYGEAILVPWDYGPDCMPVPWSRSARWIAEGGEGAFVARLRDRAHWVDGRPTLDVHAPQFVPYPIADGLRAHLARMANLPGVADPLSAVELMAVYDALTPLAREMPEQSSDTLVLQRAVAAVRRWARERPTLAQRYPATRMIGHLLDAAERRIVAARVYPERGTYRVRVVLASGDSSVFHFRTIRGRAMPVSRWEVDDESRQRAEQGRDTAAGAVGILHYVVVARRLDELPTDLLAPVHSRDDGLATGYFGALDTRMEGGARRAQLYFGSAGRLVAGDPVLISAYGERPWIPNDVDGKDYFPARLTVEPSGGTVVRHVIRRTGVTIATVEARRLSEREVVEPR